MYSTLDDFDKAIFDFGTRVDFICQMEYAGKLTSEEAYQRIKSELKALKKIHKKEKKNELSQTNLSDT